MIKLLKSINLPLTSSSEFQLVKSIKEQCCFVSQDFNKEMFMALTSSSGDQNYTLPDKQEVKIEGHARFISPEMLFKPEIGQSEG